MNSFPFSIVETIVILFCSWWMFFFLVLPFGIKADADLSEKGHDTGAPQVHHLKAKFWINSLVTLLFYILLCIFKISF
ncbi:MAG: hypothetical protein C0432_01250 [Candidatus Puniceispirillum sp.]|nr:hypothetical protein [Candidatus Pelagibacter sp.]MBA4282908.1 hypothetical protein [Candidatus Puniceispirillum sp.]